jgi:hypothetical protein
MLALPGTLLLVGALAVGTAMAAQPSTEESGNPINDQGSSYHYRTYITSISPKVAGLNVEVLEFADRLLLRNNTGKVVTIYGYSGEPYARVLPGGSAEQNVRSPAVYLNTNFYANVTVPASASSTAPPKWETVDKTGQFEWHDHRIHWMSPVTPPEVKDTSKRTKIFDWSVPIRVGTVPGVIKGELFWVPENSKASAGAIIALVVIVFAGLALVLLVRRKRRQALAEPGAPAASGAGEPGGGDREAW